MHRAAEATVISKRRYYNNKVIVQLELYWGDGNDGTTTMALHLW
jgi:hypothetical protein